MIKKILLGFLLLVIVLVVGFVAAVYLRFDRTFEAPYPAIQASTDSAMIARGRYLALGPAHCAHCHAPMADFLKVDQGQEVPLSGGFNFELPIAKIYAPNITPDEETGIGKRTDGELARALRYGVRHDGKAILDFMPFYDMSEYDLTSVISFLRSQQPVRNERPAHEFNFIGKAVVAFLIKPMGDGDVPPAPPIDSTVAYGKYLSESVANCRGCHTKRDMMTGAYIGPDYGGGTQFEVIDAKTLKIVPGKHLETPNLSPDPETGRMNGWTQKDFIDRFRKGRVIPGSPMPWGPFSRMTDLELSAIYKFLQTVEPVKNAVPLGVLEGDPE
jgi:mono/diheme cytochrome c family protein